MNGWKGNNMIEYAIKTGDKYLTAWFGYTKNINKALLYDMNPLTEGQRLVGNERVVKIEITRKEVE